MSQLVAGVTMPPHTMDGNRTSKHVVESTETKDSPRPPEQLALTAGDVADLLGVSERHVWKLHATGGLPCPIRLGRCVRWRRRELLAWLDADCPSRDKWEQARRAS